MKKVREIMTVNPDFVIPENQLSHVAAKMRQLDCGFMPVIQADRLIGVVTDRDIVIRAVSEEKGGDTPVADVMTSQVFYCFADDDIESAAHTMETEKVRRLVVIDNPENRKVIGILSLGDIATNSENPRNIGELTSAVSSEKTESTPADVASVS